VKRTLDFLWTAIAGCFFVMIASRERVQKVEAPIGAAVYCRMN
jgi:hypothetical protein